MPHGLGGERIRLFGGCDMEMITLPRNGLPDMMFRGEELSRAREHPVSADRVPAGNWWEIVLFRTDMGQLVLYSVFHIVKGGNREVPTVQLFDSTRGLSRYLDGLVDGGSPLLMSLLEKASERDKEIRQLLRQPRPAMRSGQSKPAFA